MRGTLVTLQTIGNSRKTVGMFGPGFIEMLARQMTADSKSIRNSIVPKGVSFGRLVRHLDGTWDTSKVEGVSALSVVSTAPDSSPSLIYHSSFSQGRKCHFFSEAIFEQAFNQHHGFTFLNRHGSVA